MCNGSQAMTHFTIPCPSFLSYLSISPHSSMPITIRSHHGQSHGMNAPWDHTWGCNVSCCSPTPLVNATSPPHAAALHTAIISALVFQVNAEHRQYQIPVNLLSSHTLTLYLLMLTHTRYHVQYIPSLKLKIHIYSIKLVHLHLKDWSRP